MSVQREVRPVNPEVELILVTGVEVVVDRALAFTTKPPVADKEVSARTQSHENVIVEVSVGNDVFQAEFECRLIAESLLVAFVVNRMIEESTRRAIQNFHQNQLLIESFSSNFRRSNASVFIVVRVLVTRVCQSFLYHRLIT